MYDGLHLPQLQYAVDVQPLTAGVGRYPFLLALLDPGFRGMDVMTGVYAVAEGNNLIIGQVVSELFVLSLEFLLGLLVQLAGDKCGLLVDEARPMEQLRSTVNSVVDA